MYTEEWVTLYGMFLVFAVVRFVLSGYFQFIVASSSLYMAFNTLAEVVII